MTDIKTMYTLHIVDWLDTHMADDRTHFECITSIKRVLADTSLAKFGGSSLRLLHMNVLPLLRFLYA